MEFNTIDVCETSQAEAEKGDDAGESDGIFSDPDHIRLTTFLVKKMLQGESIFNRIQI